MKVKWMSSCYPEIYRMMGSSKLGTYSEIPEIVRILPTIVHPISDVMPPTDLHFSVSPSN